MNPRLVVQVRGLFWLRSEMRSERAHKRVHCVARENDHACVVLRMFADKRNRSRRILPCADSCFNVSGRHPIGVANKVHSPNCFVVD